MGDKSIVNLDIKIHLDEETWKQLPNVMQEIILKTFYDYVGWAAATVNRDISNYLREKKDAGDAGMDKY